MAYSVQQLVSDVLDGSDDHSEVLQILTRSSLHDAVDVGLLDDDDINVLTTTSSSTAKGFLSKLREAARSILNGWASSRLVRCAKHEPSTQAQVLPSLPRSPRRGMTATKRQTMKAVTAFTARSLFGRRPQASTRIKVVKSIIDKDNIIIEKALRRIHGIFETFAASSPRISYLMSVGTSAELEMQLDIYKLKSKSATVIKRRGAQLEAFFLEIQSFGWECGTLLPFQAATWVRSRCKDAPQTAVVLAKTLLRLVQASTDWTMHLNDPIVVSQLDSGSKSVNQSDTPKQAIQLPIEVVKELESLTTMGVTPQQRCMAGFMALLASTSSRASDAQRTVNLEIKGSSLTGESRMKGRLSRTRWFCDTKGFGDSDWAPAWLHELRDQGLPGGDFLVFAPNGALDDWLPRLAAYSDIRRSLHFLLVVCCGMSVDEAVTFNPHGFRHILVTAGQQLKSLGLLVEGEVEVLGHWDKGSNMPAKYDSAAGVTELKARSTILSAFRSGWRPAADGEVPKHPFPSTSTITSSASSSCSSDPMVVVNGSNGRAHRVLSGNRRTICKWWTCGTPDLPAKDACFGSVGTSMCKHCF